MDPIEAQSKPQGRGLGPLGIALILLIAALPSWGTLNAAFIAEDAAILGRMGEAGALDDWFQAQYGIEHVVRFWRPLVSLSWWLQAEIIGPEAWPARLAGVCLHGATALVMGQLLLALGVRRIGALFGALLSALFVHQGGNVTWLAGRTDLMVGLLMLLSLWSALREHRFAAFSFALLACASKEFGFVLPLWIGMLLWARGWQGKRLWLGVLPILAACALAYAWRTLALQAWDGGYAGGGSRFGAQLLPGLLHLAQSCAPALAACVVICAFGWWRGSLHWRLAWAGLVCAMGALLPIVPLAAAQPLEAANQRLLGVAYLGLALCMAAGLARLPRGGQRAWLPLGLILPWLGWNLWQAYLDTHQWQQAAELAAEHEARGRALTLGLDADERPVLLAGVPRNTDAAYCLGLGFSDRFRAPFAPTPRPIWPLRPIFEVNLKQREMLREVQPGGLFLPFDGAPRLDLLSYSSSELEDRDWLRFDERVMPGEEDRSPKIRLHVDQLLEPAWLEAMVYTELGYGSVNLAYPILEPGPLEISLRSLVNANDNGHDLAQMLIHGADLGRSRVAYLELRLVDDRDHLLAATPWIETRWGSEFLASIGR